MVRGLASVASTNYGSSAPDVVDLGVRVWGHGGKGQLGIPKEEVRWRRRPKQLKK